MQPSIRKPPFQAPMKDIALKKAGNTYNGPSSQEVYLREEEVGRIRAFVASGESVLHICGRPGTGKTLVTLSTLVDLGIKHLYFNFFSDTGIFSKVRLSSLSCFVVDEFDRYETEKKSECRKLLAYAFKHNKKIITISNYLNIHENVLLFRPYSQEDIARIVLMKLKDEVDSNILDMSKIRHIAKKFPGGDMRLIYEHCIKVINNRDAELTGSEERDSNIHEEIIRSLMNSVSLKSEMDIFSRYLEKCKELCLSPYNRSDFRCLYDLFG